MYTLPCLSVANGQLSVLEVIEYGLVLVAVRAHSQLCADVVPDSTKQYKIVSIVRACFIVLSLYRCLIVVG